MLTSGLVDVLASSAADWSPSFERFDGSVNCCVMLCRSSVHVVTAVQKPLAQAAVGSVCVIATAAASRGDYGECDDDQRGCPRSRIATT